MEPRRELRVDGVTRDSAEKAESLDTSWHVRGSVRVDGARAAVVAGVQSAKPIHDLGTPALTNDRRGRATAAGECVRRGTARGLR